MRIIYYKIENTRKTIYKTEKKAMDMKNIFQKPKTLFAFGLKKKV